MQTEETGEVHRWQMIRNEYEVLSFFPAGGHVRAGVIHLFRACVPASGVHLSLRAWPSVAPSL